jgi:hypothetical protein
MTLSSVRAVLEDGVDAFLVLGYPGSRWGLRAPCSWSSTLFASLPGLLTLEWCRNAADQKTCARHADNRSAPEGLRGSTSGNQCAVCLFNQDTRQKTVCC